MKITGEQIKNTIKNVGMIFVGTLASAYDNSINEAGQEAFENAIEIGISNTINAQIDSGVSDEKIQVSLEKFWGISREDAIQRIVICKKQLTMNVVKEYYRLKGYSDEQTRSIWIRNGYAIILKEHPELWPLWRNPEKLVAELEKIGQKEKSALKK